MVNQLWTLVQGHAYDAFLALGEWRGMARRRRDLLTVATGRVLEIGAGTGLNVGHYPADIVELVLTEPDPAMVPLLRTRAARSPVAASASEAVAEHLPFPDSSFDTVVSTMVLCTVEDPVAVAAEIRRVLRPDGRLLFIEHVRAAGTLRAWLQDRLDPAWAKVALGCHCNRPTVEILRDTGMHLEMSSADVWRGMPGLVRPLVVGHARG